MTLDLREYAFSGLLAVVTLKLEQVVHHQRPQLVSKHIHELLDELLLVVLLSLQTLVKPHQGLLKQVNVRKVYV